MVEEIIKNIYRIPVPLPHNPLRELNAYLVKGEDRNLLIDTGFRLPECQQALEQGLAEAGADRKKLDVLVTHIHTDHTGLCDFMVGPGRHVFIGEGDYPFTDRDFDAAFWVSFDQRFLVEGFPREEVETISRINPARNLGPVLSLDIYQPIKDGEIITVGDYALQVVATPGHAPGQVCLWLEKEGILFTADHVLFDITPNIAMWPNMENALGRYLESLKKVQAYPVKLALPAHRHTADFHRRVEELLEHHRLRVAETLRIVEEEPGLTAYEVTARMTWDIRADSWEVFPLTQKWFAVCEALAHLELLMAEGSLRRVIRPDGMHVYEPVK